MVKIDIELDAMEQVVYKMGKKVIAMHDKTLSILQKMDKEVALNIISADEFINHLEEEINDKAMSNLALLSPVASDLRRIIAAIKMANELERIGDYAKNIAKFMIKHDNMDQYILDYAEQMVKTNITMLDDAMRAYEERDIDVAFSIPEKDREIDQLYQELKTKLQTGDELELYQHLVSLSAMLRNIERTGDHIINICEITIFLIKGQHYDFG